MSEEGAAPRPRLSPQVLLVGLALFLPMGAASYAVTRRIVPALVALLFALGMGTSIGARTLSVARLAAILVTVYLACGLVIVIAESH